MIADLQRVYLKAEAGEGHGGDETRRAGQLARVLADAGVVAIVSLRGPDDAARSGHEDVGLNLVEVELGAEELDLAVERVWARLVAEGVVPGER